MGKIYVGQVLQITLDTLVDIRPAANPAIVAFPPAGAPRNWPAQVVGESKLQYTTTKGTDLDVAGVWRFQAAPAVLGVEAPGETVSLTIHPMGS